ncbi:MAG: CRISPR-associated endonuclease Cas6 [Bacteroidota bacterium]
MPLLQIHFDLDLPPQHLRAFRAAIAERAGFEHEHFHHHHNRSGHHHYHWSYPLIQFRAIPGGVQLTGIHAGAHAIKTHLLPRLGSSLRLLDREVPLHSYRVSERPLQLSRSSTLHHYHLDRWIALNRHNFREWKKTPPDRARPLLSRALTGQLRALGEGLGVDRFKEVVGEVHRVAQQRTIRWKNIPMLAFRVQLRCNLQLDPALHLGRLAAYGFGRLRGEEKPGGTAPAEGEPRQSHSVFGVCSPMPSPVRVPPR